MTARDKDSGEPMPDRELIDEVLTLIVAGHETTASALNWTWYLVSQHPRGRGAAARGDRRRARRWRPPGLRRWRPCPTPSRSSTRRCACIRPGWLLSRRTIEADRAGRLRQCPPGTNVLLPLYLLHRHPQFWNDPEASGPSASRRSTRPSRPRFAYMPFAAGPRHCIGETLALYEMLMHLYKVARHYRLTLRTGQAAGARGADQPAHPSSTAHEAGTPLMLKR